MLTGDDGERRRPHRAAAGIDRVLAEILPRTRRRDRAAAESPAGGGDGGDGINDAPALACRCRHRDGSGTDVAIEAADVTLMRGDLRGVVAAVISPAHDPHREETSGGRSATTSC